VRKFAARDQKTKIEKVEPTAERGLGILKKNKGKGGGLSISSEKVGQKIRTLREPLGEATAGRIKNYKAKIEIPLKRTETE